MLRLDLSIRDPYVNLSLDEALLLAAEAGGEEVIRFWRFLSTVVVIGRGSKVREEVNVEFCQQQQIPILRRCSGGAAIVAGPDCWMYSVVLSMHLRPMLRQIDHVHQFVMGTFADAVSEQCSKITQQGICDLAVESRKVSGNSLRVARDHVLYHGTLLEKVDKSLVASCLLTPPRQPDYRQARSHEAFIAALPIDTHKLSNRLAELYQANQVMQDVPQARAEQLSLSKYRSNDWTWRH